MRNLFLLLFLTGASFPIDFAPVIAGDATHRADLNDDRRVDAEDLLILLNAWHSTPNDRFIDSLYYYRVDGTTVSLTASEIAIGIAFQQTAMPVDRDKFLIDYSILSHFIDEESTHIFRIALSEALPIYDMIELLDVLAKDSRVDFVTPVFQLPTGEALMDITFLTRFLTEITDHEIEELNILFGVDIIESGRLIQNGGIFRLAPSRNEQFPHDPRNAITALYLANLYHEHPDTEFSSPHFHTAAVSRATEIEMLLEAANFTMAIPATSHSKIAHSSLPIPFGIDTNAIDTQYVAVKFKQMVTTEERQLFLRQDSLLASIDESLSTGSGFSIFEFKEKLARNTLEWKISQIAMDDRVSFVTPVYRWLNSGFLLFTDTFIVKFREDTSDSDIQMLNMLNNVEVVKPGYLRHRNGRYLLLTLAPLKD